MNICPGCMLELTCAMAMNEPSLLKVRIRSPSFTPRFAASSGLTYTSGSPRCRLNQQRIVTPHAVNAVPRMAHGQSQRITLDGQRIDVNGKLLALLQEPVVIHVELLPAGQRRVGLLVARAGKDLVAVGRIGAKLHIG